MNEGRDGRGEVFRKLLNQEIPQTLRDGGEGGVSVLKPHAPWLGLAEGSFAGLSQQAHRGALTMELFSPQRVQLTLLFHQYRSSTGGPNEH